MTGREGVRDESSHAAAGITVPAIVETTLAVIAERGVPGLTMARVAERLGVRTPSLYHHVQNKAALLALVARDAYQEFAEERDAYADVTSVEEWVSLVQSGTLRVRAYFAAHPGLALVALANATPDRDQEELSRGELARAQIEALVRLGMPRPAAKDVYEACSRWTGAAVAAEHAAGLTGDARDDDLFRRGLSLLLAGVRADIEQTIGDGRARRLP